MVGNISSSVSWLAKRSPGATLILVSFATIFGILTTQSVRSTDASPSIAVYLVIVFSFLLALAGIALLFRENRAITGISEQPLDSAQDLGHAVTQLGKNYEILRAQATQGFILAGVFMALGMFAILAGAVGELFGLTAKGANLTTVAGVIVESISGIGLYLFRQTFERLNVTSDRLHDTWKVLTAFERAEFLPDSQKAEVMRELIVALATPSAKPSK